MPVRSDDISGFGRHGNYNTTHGKRNKTQVNYNAPSSKVDIMTCRQYNASSGAVQPKNARLIGGQPLKHEPDNMLVADFGDEKKTPHVIAEAIRRIIAREKTKSYYHNLLPLFYHPPKVKDGNTKKSRKYRSEREESMLNILLPHLLHTLNLRRMACGYYTERQNSKSPFTYYTPTYFAKKSGLSRVCVLRCLSILRSLGIVRVKKRVEETVRGIRTKEIRISFSSKIFKMLHLHTDYLKGRKYTLNKFEKKERAIQKELRELNRYESVQDGSGRPHCYLSPRAISTNYAAKVQDIASKINTVLPYSKTDTTATHKTVTNAYTKGFSTNPYQDKEILIAASDLISETKKKTGDIITLKDAVQRICLKLGKAPPDH